MPLTYSGRLVRPGNGEHPSLLDIAIGLSRQPRFAGQTRRWWSVLDHTLFCDELGQHFEADGFTSEGLRLFRLGLLLHDAHEAITADVPSDVKPSALKSDQGRLDEEIFNAYFPRGGAENTGLDHYQMVYECYVKHKDRLALIAESRVVGPPAPMERTMELFGTADDAAEAEKMLTIGLSHLTENGSMPYLGNPPSAFWPERHPAVVEYLHRMNTLL
jgi:hypothetical protein